MKKINYLQILKDAWKITWKNRYLWWFGLFILLSSGGSTSSKSFEEKDFHQLSDFIAAHQQIILAVGAVLLIAWIVIVILSIISKGAIIKSIQKNTEGKENNFRDGFREGKKYFWKLILIWLLAFVFSLAAAFVFIVPAVLLFINDLVIFGSIMVFVAVVVLVPVFFLICFSAKFGSFYVVMADLRVWDSLEKGYDLILNNVGKSIIMALLLFVVNIIPLILFLTLLVFLAIPFLMLGGLLYLFLKTIGIILVGCLAGVVFVILLLIVGSVLQVFLQTTWVLFFKEIAKSEEREEIKEVAEDDIKETEATSVLA
jgi:hypothetical protein